MLTAINNEYNTQEKLAKEMSLDTSTLSRQLKRLVEKGMVHKTAIGKDRRQLVYNIDEKGVNAYKSIENDYQTFKLHIFEQWTDEEKNMLKILLNRLENSMTKNNKWSE
ncbi:MarR family winged helix-turn-helix transcriptional regulator [Fructilactobacillus lindneri]|uniref:HTH marR-type domain-containing protein n=1 Tax=Fructilactobacillus lindneri DSM 20690 = JCM 11027 TaxID=1122148 RepID=A0A0R2JPD3_9LACO|nr:MarR family transcriptional regulator [Fructilactobacillus lindneri]KRN79001.1 hypothetical protein IV52_GL000405 [Fructilactobacillus lindneri DSM 20690 = JCM 11027]SJZ78035.1 transcriptional regulator, HxlR family [Fructilactobacillus lindneri DSM 20690 = JCM 11027]